MSKADVICCPGCSAIVSSELLTCAGCGRCIFCGSRRADRQTHCLECDIPYCTCCGRCAGCGSTRYAEVDHDCDCETSRDLALRAKFIEDHRPRREDEKPGWKLW